MKRWWVLGEVSYVSHTHTHKLNTNIKCTGASTSDQVIYSFIGIIVCFNEEAISTGESILRITHTHTHTHKLNTNIKCTGASTSDQVIYSFIGITVCFNEEAISTGGSILRITHTH